MRSMIPFGGIFRKWGNKTIGDVTQQFKNPFMREAFPHIFNLENPPEFPILAVMKTLAWMNQRTGGYPVGGSLELARTIEKRYLSLGGKVNYRSKVVKIIVENDKAVGIKLSDGAEHRGDFVISAADGRTTIFDMLDGNYINKKIKGYYNNMALFSPLIYVGLGVNNAYKEIPSTVTGINFHLAQALAIGNQRRSRMSVQFYTFDSTLAPEGKTFVRVHFPTDYEYWKKLKKDKDRYKAEKKKIANEVVDLIDKRFPGFASKVEMIDVATPMTWVRYTGNWKGSFQGWIETTKTLRMRMSQKLPGLSNFYMAGQWVRPGGSVPAVAMSGRHAVQIVCANDRREFVTRKP
jgi:phytoene dehydrogenase-like protein